MHVTRDVTHMHTSDSGNTGEKASKAMHAIAEAVTQCKFEATNPAADEVVLYKILQVVHCYAILPTCISVYCIEGFRSSRYGKASWALDSRHSNKIWTLCVCLRVFLCLCLCVYLRACLLAMLAALQKGVSSGIVAWNPIVISGFSDPI